MESGEGSYGTAVSIGSSTTKPKGSQSVLNYHIIKTNSESSDHHSLETFIGEVYFFQLKFFHNYILDFFLAKDTLLKDFLINSKQTFQSSTKNISRRKCPFNKNYLKLHDGNEDVHVLKAYELQIVSFLFLTHAPGK